MTGSPRDGDKNKETTGTNGQGNKKTFAIVSLIVIPLLAAAIGALGPRMIKVFDADPAPRIEIDDMTVAMHHPDIEGPSTLDLKLRNIGNQISVIKDVTLKIERFIALPHCASQGNLPDSGSYKNVMPTHPAQDERVNIQVSQQVGPNRADRFKLNLRIGADENEVVYLYRVSVAVTHDNDAEPVSAGEAIIVLPFIPNHEWFWTKNDARHDPWTYLHPMRVEPCLQKNAKQLSQMLAQSGTRTKELLRIPATLAFR